MSSIRIIAQAPSNIALVKYMGKKDSQRNLPDNPSLSLTLSRLCSVVELNLEVSSSQSSAAQSNRDQAENSGSAIQWLPELPHHLPHGRGEVPQLSDSGIQKVIRHVERVKKEVPSLFAQWGLSVHESQWGSSRILLKTANTFPQASGIASSASSFAALTLASAAAFCSSREAFQKLWNEDVTFKRALAQISRQGSGSSCRSFEGPWVQWSEDQAHGVEHAPGLDLAHFVVLIKTDPKKVSSSEAHLRIKSSPLWAGRVQRTQSRVDQLQQYLKQGHWEGISQIAWDEAWEMHSLFHTSEKPFSYWEPGTLVGLKYFAEPQASWPSSPVVTLDAGPNLHVLVLRKDVEFWRAQLKGLFPDYCILEDIPGNGASLEAWEGV